MPKVIIDRRSIEVPAGTKIITAAEQLGIVIPRFCYHPALGAVGACRVCAVKFVEGPVKGIQMSCMVDAQDGMVVATDDPEAVDFRRMVIEWLMVNHPHDCPVCDEGGHCLLQELTVAGGHGRRRYPGAKRTHHDQYLGPLVQHEMNRCIHCYRCSRFYQEYAGYRDLGVLGVAGRVYFGRQTDGVLENPFSGNLIDICPTGVYTDKPSRYFGRRWDFERSPAICISCSLGCHTTVSVRYRQVVRQEARPCEPINGHFICDRGRQAHFYAGSPERPRAARVDQAVATVDQALATAAERLADQIQRRGPQGLALWGGARGAVETMAALRYLGWSVGGASLCFFDDTAQAAAVRQAVTLPSVPLSAAAAADYILLLGADPLNEAPIAALTVRQAVRRGAQAVSYDPRPVGLPCALEHHPLSCSALQAFVIELENVLLGHAAAAAVPVAAEAARLQKARRPLVIFGTEWLDAQAIAAIGRFVQSLTAQGATAGLLPLLPTANAFAAALFADGEPAADELLSRIESGRVTSLVLVENDPFARLTDRNRLEAALRSLELLVVIDYLPGPAAELASIFLPSTTIYESGGTYLNNEGRAQRMTPALRGGLPLTQTNAGGYPPRRYDLGLPGDDPRPTAELLQALAPARTAMDHGALVAWLGGQMPFFRPLAATDRLPEEGLRLGPAPAAIPGATPTESSATHDALELLAAPVLFGGEELADHAPPLRELERPPQLTIAPADARRWAVADGDKLAIDTGCGTLYLPVRVCAEAAAGVLSLPRRRGTAWQQLGTRRQLLAPTAIRKAQ